MKKPKPHFSDVENLRGYFRNRYIIPALRRIARWWPPSQEAVKRATKNGGVECASCKKVFKRKDVHRDHIEPVIDPSTGFTSWDSYINRLLAPVEAFQLLCVPCHTQKSKKENKIRRGKSK